jgi:mannosyl-3-phosphoglycerate phosphatase
MIVVFTDLDGTLLNTGTYAWDAARPALKLLRARGIPCILVTSKTRAETVFWRRRLRIRDPFIVENGAAAFVPAGYFPFDLPGAKSAGRFVVQQWGTPYSTLVAALEEASRSAGCKVIGFHQMSARAVSEACKLTPDQALLAKQREFDEPFRIVDPARAAALLGEIEARGLHWTVGDRFYHVCGANDKASAVRAISSWFGRLHEHVNTIGLGDALNDAPFLESVDVPVVVRSPFAASLASQIPNAIITREPGPLGWNEAVRKLLRF